MLLSADQLKDFGINWVIIGHSERRQFFGATDAVVAKQVALSLKAGLKVIACIGETLDERNTTLFQFVFSFALIFVYVQSSCCCCACIVFNI